MTTRVQKIRKDRLSFRVPLREDEHVWLITQIAGHQVQAVVDELSAGGARFGLVPGMEQLRVGSQIGPALLVLPDFGMPVVYPLVKWMIWPVVGVEFADLGDKNRELIFRYLYQRERQRIAGVA